MPNVVSTTADRTNAAKAAAGAEARKAATKMSFGNGAVIGAGAPRVPLTTDVGLQNKTLTKALESITYPIGTTVRYTARIAFAELNGSTVNEISLEDAAGVTLAIKTFDPITKNNEIELTFDWDDAY